MTRKKLVSVLLALTLALSLLPTAAFAEEAGNTTPEKVYVENTHYYPVGLPMAIDDGESLVSGTYVDSFGKLLQGNAKTIYDALVSEKSNMSNTAKFTNDQYGYYFNVNTGVNVDSNLQALYAALSCFDRDYPEIFWFDGIVRGGTEVGLVAAKDWNPKKGGGRTLADDITALNTAVSAVETAAKAKTTQYERLKVVHDWLIKNNYYNNPATTNDYKNTHTYTPWTPLSAMRTDTVENGVEMPVCEGYARAFKMICDALKIPCALIAGAGHMWNYVKVDIDGNGTGKWYLLDATHDDPVLSGSGVTEETNKRPESGGERWTYFLINYQNGSATHKSTSPTGSYGGQTANCFIYPDVVSGARETNCPVPAKSVAFDVDVVGDPVAGGTPDYEAALEITYATYRKDTTLTAPGGNGAVAWYNGNEVFNGQFEAGNTYTAKIEVTSYEVIEYPPKSGTHVPVCMHQGITSTSSGWVIAKENNKVYLTRDFTVAAAPAATVESVEVSWQSEDAAPLKIEVPGGDTPAEAIMTAAVKMSDSSTNTDVSWGVVGTVPDQDLTGVRIVGNEDGTATLYVTKEAQGGEVTVIATSQADTSKAGSCLVTITRKPSTATTIVVKNGQTAVGDALSIKTGGSVTLTAQVLDQYGVEMPAVTPTLTAAGSNITVSGMTVTATGTAGSTDTLTVTAGGVTKPIEVTIVKKEDAGITIKGLPDRVSYGDVFTLTAEAENASTGGKWTWNVPEGSALQVVNGAAAYAAASDAITLKAVNVVPNNGSVTVGVTYTDGDYTGTASTDITIQKRVLDLSGISAKDREYGGGTYVDLEGTVGNIPADGPQVGLIDLTAFVESETNDALPGKDLPVTIGWKKGMEGRGSIYELPETNLTVTISKAALNTSLAVKDGETIYSTDTVDALKQKLKVTDDLQYIANSEFDLSLVWNPPAAGGTYDLKWTLTPKPANTEYYTLRYENIPVTGTLTIDIAERTVANLQINVKPQEAFFRKFFKKVLDLKIGTKTRPTRAALVGRIWCA